MDYSFMIPQEGFGFSNYYHKGLTAPKFDKFAVEVDGSDEEVLIEVKYM